MRVTWDDVGRTTEPGVHTVDGEPVNIAVRNIEIWREKPDAVFQANWHRGGYSPQGGVYMLGTREE